MQSTLLKLYRAWPRISGLTFLDSYGHRTLERIYLDARRARLREHAAHRLADGPRAAESADLRLTLLAAVGKLPPLYRAVVVLRYWEDLSVEQTARALGCTSSAVKSRSFRALAMLRDRIDADIDSLHDA